MPTYEYECKDCGANDEIKQRITEDALQECPHCGSTSYGRLIGGGGFILKGSGWYADGYSGSSGSTASAASSQSSGSSSSGGGHSCGSGGCGCG